MKLRQLSVLILFIWGACLASSATCAASVSLVGLANLSDPKIQGGSPEAHTARAVGGGGVLLGISFVPLVSELELGILYLPKRYDYQTNEVGTTTASATNERHYVQVPLLVRLWLFEAISFGAGGYAAYGIGKVRDGGLNYSYPQFGYEALDYGVVGSVGLRVPILLGAALWFDGRYCLGLRDIDKSADRRTERDMMLLAGLRLGF